MIASWPPLIGLLYLSSLITETAVFFAAFFNAEIAGNAKDGSGNASQGEYRSCMRWPHSARNMTTVTCTAFGEDSVPM
jgi:hypothetical protein